MIHRFMISVAAVALIAAGSLVHAEGAGEGHEAPAAGAMRPNAAPAERGGGHADEPGRASSAPRAAQVEPKTPSAGNGPRGEDRMQEPKTGSMEQQKSEPTRTGARDNGGADERKAEGLDKAPARDGMKAEGRDDRNGSMKAETRDSETRSQTVGQAGAGAKLSTEQRTQIKTVIRDVHVQPLTNVNFSISVGARVPHDVEFHPLPAEIVSLYPDWRGYEFILVRDQILVIDPATFEIVAVLEA
jgi:hypothetical protein